MSRINWKVLAPILAVIAAAVGVTFISIDDNGDGKPDRVSVTVKVDTLDKSPDKDKTIIVPKAAVEQAEKSLSGEINPPGPLDQHDADHTDLRDETPEGAPASVLENNTEKIQENRETTAALPTAGATGGFVGCRTQFVVNQSSRRGVRPTVQVLHYTVSPNRPGWSDVNAITSFFNQSRTQASSHFIIDSEGHCAYIVPIESKAWANAGGNAYSVQYEVINSGSERVFMASAGYAKLRSVMLEVSRRTGIPMRQGKITGCAPSRSGNVQHADGGVCWGGHHDIGPFSLAAVLSHVQTSSCNRACDVRRRNSATHRSLRNRRCADSKTTRSEACKTLHRRHAALHKIAKVENIKL